MISTAIKSQPFLFRTTWPMAPEISLKAFLSLSVMILTKALITYKHSYNIQLYIKKKVKMYKLVDSICAKGTLSKCYLGCQGFPC